MTRHLSLASPLVLPKIITNNRLIMFIIMCVGRSTIGGIIFIYSCSNTRKTIDFERNTFPHSPNVPHSPLFHAQLRNFTACFVCYLATKTLQELISALYWYTRGLCFSPAIQKWWDLPVYFRVNSWCMMEYLILLLETTVYKNINLQKLDPKNNPKAQKIHKCSVSPDFPSPGLMQ